MRLRVNNTEWLQNIDGKPGRMIEMMIQAREILAELVEDARFHAREVDEDLIERAKQWLKEGEK